MDRNRLARLFLALGLAAAIGMQIPARQGTALARDGYIPRGRNGGRFLGWRNSNEAVASGVLVGLVGAKLLRTLGDKGKVTTVSTSAPPTLPVASPCAKATLAGDAEKSLYDVLAGDARRKAALDALPELKAALAESGPLTALVPPDGGALSAGNILIGRYKYEDLCRLADGKKLLLLTGETRTLGNKSGKVTLDGVEVLPVDGAAKNGWFHPLKSALPAPKS